MSGSALPSVQAPAELDTQLSYLHLPPSQPPSSSISLHLATVPPGKIDWHLEEDGLHFGAVLAHLLIHDGVEDVLGRDAGVGNALIVAHHPDEDVGNSVLGL